MKKLTLTIEMGNAAMKTRAQVAAALKDAAAKIHLDDFGKIRDANGNTVGKWSIE